MANIPKKQKNCFYLTNIKQYKVKAPVTIRLVTGIFSLIVHILYQMGCVYGTENKF